MTTRVDEVLVNGKYLDIIKMVIVYSRRKKTLIML